MTLQELNCFLTVSETLNYTKAAEELHISQPAVSKYILSLERELGVLLIDRSIRKSIKLTSSGTYLKECLLRCQKDFSDTLENIQLHSAALPMSINFPDGCAPSLDLFKIFDTFHNNHPEINASINFILPNKFPEALNNGEFLVCEKSMLPPGKQFQTHAIAHTTTSYYLIASGLHPVFQNNEHPQAKDFDTYPLFLSKTLLPSQIAFYQNLVKKTVGEHVTSMFLDSIDSTILYLLSNTGFSVVNQWSRWLHTSGLKVIELDYATHYCFAWNPTKIANCFLPELIQML